MSGKGWTIPKPPGAPEDYRCGAVHGYVLLFLPDRITVVERDGEYYLPGGVIPGVLDIDGFPNTGPRHFYPMADYVREQTGLILTDLSDAVQIIMSPLTAHFELSVFYLAYAEGRQTRGTPTLRTDLPRLHYTCDDPSEMIERHQISEGEYKRRRMPKKMLDGVYKTTTAVGQTSEGKPTRYYFRFYPDGYVIQGSFTNDVESEWEKIAVWLHRDQRRDGLGYGHYMADSERISFTTISTKDSRGRNLLVADHTGVIRGGRLLIEEYIRGGSRCRYELMPTQPASKGADWLKRLNPFGKRT